MNIASLEDTAAQMGQISKLVRLLATSGITSEHLQRAIDNTSARANLVEFLQAECPTVDYSQPAPKARREFDEAAFFRNRRGLSVDDDLKRSVGFQMRQRRRAIALKFRQLDKREIEAEMFGLLGSGQYAETLDNAVELSQIAELIIEQEAGISGALSYSHTNVFPVFGLDNELYVVYVRWSIGDREWKVCCRPFDANLFWNANCRVFSN